MNDISIYHFLEITSNIPELSKFTFQRIFFVFLIPVVDLSKYWYGSLGVSVSFADMKNIYIHVIVLTDSTT